MENFDTIIVGAGQAGGPLATAFSSAGKKTALVEKKYVGGTCINVGCTPTKTMVASAEIAHLARISSQYGIHHDPIVVNLDQVRQRKDEIVTSFRHGSEKRIISGGTELIYGTAAFLDAKTLQVQLRDGGKRTLSAGTIILNVGARPHLPKLAGLAQTPFLDSSSIMELETIPQHLLILGGGYIALEFGQMFRRFGSQVSIVQRSSQLLDGEDEDVASAVLEILRQDGIQVFLDTEATSVMQNQSGEVVLEIAAGQEKHTLKGSHLLLATGRTPNSDTLHLENAGVTVDSNGFIPVNERLETLVPGIYAAGDVKGGPGFTHISYDDYRILRENLLENGSLTTRGRPVPYVLYIDPQLGRIGLSERQAKAEGLNYQLAKMPMSYVARAIETGRTQGFMKVLVDAESRKILGAAILGVEGGEIMSMLQIAMMGRLPYTALRDAIFAHPTYAESLNNLFGSLE